MKKIIALFMTIVCLISLSGCSTKEKINVGDIDKNNIKVRIDICGGYDLVQYVTILTQDNKVISFDGREDTEASIVLLDTENSVQQIYIKRCLEELQNCESKDVDFGVEESDQYDVQMYIGDKVFKFTYGCAQNPYANILTEILLSYSEVDELDNILPYPSKFRIRQG